MAQLDFVLNQFHDDLKRAGELLSLVKEFRKFASSKVPVEVENGSVPWEDAVNLAAAAPNVRTDLPIFSGSILLYICGRFEYFVREVVVSLADDMAAQAEKFADLPEEVRRELRTRTLDIAQNPRRYNYSESEVEQLLVTLGRSLDSNGTMQSVTIASRVLSVTEANMNQRVLADMFNRVARRGFWQDAGKQAILRTYLSKRNDGECTAEAQSRLETIMKERNGVAHPIGATSFPDADKVLEYTAFFKVLSQVVVDLARIPK